MTSEAFLTQVLQSHSPSHAYLFFGPRSALKEEKAKAFATALLCQQQGTAPCKTCIACKKIESGNHPDFRIIEPEGQKIKIAQIRAIKSELQYGPLEAPWKVILIPRGEALTEEAAQSMLKILEEPPPKTMFILTAEHPSSILPTIASRCQRVPFTSESTSLLSHMEVPEELLDSAGEILFSRSTSPLEIFDKVTVLEDHKEMGEKIAHALFGFYRDVAVAKAGWEEGLLFPKFKEQSLSLASQLSWWQIYERIRKIAEVEDHLDHSGNFRLVFENLLYKLQMA